MHRHTQSQREGERESGHWPITSIAALISTTNKLTYLEECCGTYISGVESQRIYAYDRVFEQQRNPSRRRRQKGEKINITSISTGCSLM